MRTRSTFLALALALLGCGDKAAPPPAAPGGPTAPVKLKLLLNWNPDSQHGGYYAAQVKGYFREAGLDVEILGNTQPNMVVQRVVSGEADFGVSNADRVLFGRAGQAPIVAVMAPLQHSPRCVMVHASAEITDFKQLSQLKTLALSTGPAENVFLAKKLDLANVAIVQYQGNVGQFLTDGASFGQQAYSISEPFSARARGAEPRCLMVSALGYDPYASLLITSEKMLAEHPDIVRKMVNASVRGWGDYLVDWAATNGQIQSKNKDMSLEILEFGAKELKPLVEASGGPIGRMSLDRWAQLTAQLDELGLLKPAGSVDPSKAFNATFLPDPAAGSK